MNKYIWILLLTMVSCSWMPGQHEPYPKEPDQGDMTVFYSGEEKYILRVPTDAIGFLVKDSVDEQSVRDLVASEKYKIMDRYEGGIYVLNIGRDMTRSELVKLARKFLEQYPKKFSKPDMLHIPEKVPPRSSSQISLSSSSARTLILRQ